MPAARRVVAACADLDAGLDATAQSMDARATNHLRAPPAVAAAHAAVRASGTATA